MDIFGFKRRALAKKVEQDHLKALLMTPRYAAIDESMRRIARLYSVAAAKNQSGNSPDWPGWIEIRQHLDFLAECEETTVVPTSIES